ncbi:hypothetical protein Anas_01828 [Armadillidium nasatum]|uniref:Uncharacterized protein n=1 Tax=Armadillidium nasatum TaxID=96803 RepID=A0A5N5SJM9_9CRUS|nr:hypothetical protein Anas_01828 [Armadillidium nasatum]
MGAKSSTAAGSSGATLSSGGADSDTRSRALSTSAGTSDSGIGLLRSASQGAGGSGNGATGPPNSSSIVRDRVGDRGRTRSLSSVPGVSNGATALSIPTLLSRTTGSGAHSLGGGGNTSSETEGSSPEDYATEGPLTSLGLGRVFATHSLPAHLWSFNVSTN